MLKCMNATMRECMNERKGKCVNATMLYCVNAGMHEWKKRKMSESELGN